MAETSQSDVSGSGSESRSGPDPSIFSQTQRDLKNDPKQMKEMLADLSSQFRNFDDPATYCSLVDEALRQNTANFAVRFGMDHSEIATNLTSDNMRTLLANTAPENKNESVVTWMCVSPSVRRSGIRANPRRNIWSPTQNRDIVEAIAHKYKFSVRLGVTILGWDEARWQVTEKLKHPKTSSVGISRLGDHGRPRARRTFNPRAADPETVIPHPVAEARAAATRAGIQLPELHEEDLHMYKLLQEQYNYTTIDHGSNCMCCLGYCSRTLEC